MSRKTNPPVELRKRAAGRRTITAPLTLDRASRSADGELRLTGYASVFDSESEDLGGFRESIAPGAFRRVLERGDECLLLWNHDSGHVLAKRSTGSLRLAEDAKGLRVDATMVPTSTARDVALLLEAGVVDGMSFGFVVGSDRWTERDGTPHRTVTRISQLIEVTLTAMPAYRGTEAELAERDLEQVLVELRAKAAATRAAHDNLNHKKADMTTDTTTTRGRVTDVRDRPVYGDGSPYSFFRDLVLRDLAQPAPADLPRYPGANQTTWRLPTRPGDEIEQVRQRLASVEERALSSTGGAGGEFVPAGGLPQFLAAEFTTAARARAVAAPLLNPEPLPSGGLAVKLPRIVNPASVAPQASEGSAVSATDPTTAEASGPVGLIAGEVLMSNQLVDLGLPAGGDTAIAAELGAAYAAKLDDQVLNGAGSSGELRGFRNWSGVSALTWTQASPSPALFRGALGSLASTTATALGAPLEHFFALLHPRRHAWLLAAQTEAAFAPAVRLVGCASIPTNIGGSQDAVILVGTGTTRLYVEQPVVKVVRDRTANATGQAAVQIRSYASLVVPVPVGVGVMTGSGLTTPTFTT